MTAHIRTEAEYWITYEWALETFGDWSDKFIGRENAIHNHEDALANLGTAIQNTRRAHVDMVHFGGTRGCFQVHIAMKGLELYLAGTNAPGDTGNDEETARRARIHFVQNACEGSREATRYFGAELSRAVEARIREWLVEQTAAARFVPNDSRFAVLLDELDNVTITWRFGRASVLIGGITRELVAGQSLTFDADERLSVMPNHLLFPDDVTAERVLMDLNIVAGHKGAITMRSDSASFGTGETITRTAKNQWQLLGSAWNENTAKITPATGYVIDGVFAR